ncbi:multiheme c-type cytochrome [Deferrisoma palaeochoriense]
MTRPLASKIVALGLALAWAGPAGAGKGPHALLADRDRCGHCHEGVPRPGDRGPHRFKKDIVSLCLECHRDKDLSSLHPVDIRPGSRIPADLPLDEHGTLTCATCHDPHAPAEADEPYVAEPIARRLLSVLKGRKRHRTYFLRRRNDEGQLCLGCHDRSTMAAEPFHAQEASVLSEYAGSEACRECHRDIYDAWKLTPHARMARDARKDPGAVLGDFSADPPFPKDQIVYALGSHWTQRYVVEKNGKLYVKAAIWGIVQKQWDRSYWIDKPWIPYCAGCHTTGFEPGEPARWAELGIGCEACHGPARAHATSAGEGPVVNPADLEPVRRQMICEACHTTGHDRTGQFRFPVGYLPGRDLTRYYKGLLPKPGQDNTTFAGDESYEDRHRQWEFWVEHFMDARGLSCDICKNFRSQLEKGEKPRMTPSEYCLTCHAGTFPRTPEHERHLAGGVHCHECHDPLRTAEGNAYSIHDHKFLFLEPGGPPVGSPQEACRRCHGPGPEARKRE